MTSKTKKTLLAVVLALVAIAGITGYMLWNKPHKDVEAADAVSITATDLYSIYITDTAKAKLLYTDKVLLVSGKVNRVSTNLQAQQVIYMETPVSGAYINCTMEAKADAVKAGNDITIKGICSGYISGDADMGLPGDVFLVRGYILKGK